MAARSLHDDGPPGASIGWEALEPWQHGRWEAAAQAAVDESDSLLTAQLAMAQETISDLAAERDEARAVAAEFRAQLETAVREGDELRDQLAAVRERLENLAAGMETSAAATTASRKSEIERGCAQAVREIAEAAK
jgi:uncharacterized coiled-coil DUF342 family protein